MSMNGPEEPSANMRELARAFRDMYVALVQEGFTEGQALVMIGQVIAAQLRGGSE